MYHEERTTERNEAGGELKDRATMTINEGLDERERKEIRGKKREEGATRRRGDDIIN